MSDKQRRQAAAAARDANQLRALAIAANGHGVSRQDRNRAAEKLHQAVGERKAQQLQEDALRQAGAGAKGLRRFFG
ncbi:hypothetical protein ACIBHY_53950 [Nonomuraea sp. NPDC050547]|uniref:hypothetical protein n=1 Tax=Nonomuraea sp. NPDC050547 TaxID=3364368 RepID=UPI0037A0D308